MGTYTFMHVGANGRPTYQNANKQYLKYVGHWRIDFPSRVRPNYRQIVNEDTTYAEPFLAPAGSWSEYDGSIVTPSYENPSAGWRRNSDIKVVCTTTRGDFVAVYSSARAFAALRKDGSIAAWGDSGSGGSGAPAGFDFVAIYSSNHGFSAMREDGSIAFWGGYGVKNGRVGGRKAYVTEAPTGSDFVSVYSNGNAYAALREDGSITAWGLSDKGGCEWRPGRMPLYNTNCLHEGQKGTFHGTGRRFPPGHVSYGGASPAVSRCADGPATPLSLTPCQGVDVFLHTLPTQPPSHQCLACAGPRAKGTATAAKTTAAKYEYGLNGKNVCPPGKYTATCLPLFLSRSLARARALTLSPPLELLSFLFSLLISLALSLSLSLSLFHRLALSRSYLLSLALSRALLLSLPCSQCVVHCQQMGCSRCLGASCCVRQVAQRLPRRENAGRPWSSSTSTLPLVGKNQLFPILIL